jgi:cytochrome b pre-mRNA-processing protein 3
MLAFLFRRLTAEPERGAKLFAALTAEARRPHWYVEGTVPDTLDGRFAVLATVAALALVRIEQTGDAGNAASVALTERFIQVMESEHRELGLGDPTLGRTVRKLVGSLARRVELWRQAVAGERGWVEAAHDSLYRGRASPEALVHSSSELERLWTRLERAGLDQLGNGRLD